MRPVNHVLVHFGPEKSRVRVSFHEAVDFSLDLVEACWRRILQALHGLFSGAMIDIHLQRRWKVSHYFGTERELVNARVLYSLSHCACCILKGIGGSEVWRPTDCHMLEDDKLVSCFWTHHPRRKWWAAAVSHVPIIGWTNLHAPKSNPENWMPGDGTISIFFITVDCRDVQSFRLVYGVYTWCWWDSPTMFRFKFLFFFFFKQEIFTITYEVFECEYKLCEDLGNTKCEIFSTPESDIY